LAAATAIRKAFNNLDNEITRAALNSLSEPPASARAITDLAPAVSGSCALLSIFDQQHSMLRVACVGDSRAVLGRYNSASGTYEAIPLSVDQTGFNAAEVDRIKKAHPEENEIIDPKEGRLLGFMITRAFGDHRLKWTREQIDSARERYWGSKPRPHYTSPPYMTADPVVTETKIEQESNADFVIMASDGVWDHISNEDAVKCVSLWLEQRRGRQPESSSHPRNRSASEPEIRIEAEQAPSWRAVPKYFVVEDENAATHLIRNVFGGSRKHLFLGIMNAYPPMSREVRDDVTVHILFFGNDSRSAWY
jgi:pyruvate dehydrogenase phosphatase